MLKQQKAIAIFLVSFYIYKKNILPIHQKILLLFFFLPVSSIYAQKSDSHITVLGNLYNAKTFEPVEFAHVINTRNYNATISDSLGNFKIRIRKTDTLMITSIGYETKKISYARKQQNIIFESIPMEEKLYKIKRVEVTPWGTYRELKNRFLSLDTVNPRKDVHPLIWRDLPRKPDSIINKEPDLTSPISLIYYMLSPEGKSIRKLKELEKIKTKNDKIRPKYNRDIVSEITGLEDKALERFMKFCNFTDSYLLNTKKYKILKRVKDMYQTYEDSLNNINPKKHDQTDTIIQRH